MGTIWRTERESALSSVTTAISTDFVSPLERAIRTICNPIIKVDGTVMPRAAFLSTLLARLCHARLLKALLWFHMSSSSTSDPKFHDFPKKKIFVFENSRLQKPFYNRIWECQCSVLYFCLVWKARLYLYCRCKIPCFVDFFGLS